MSVDVWVVLALIPILLVALFFYLVLRIIWATLRGIGTLLRWGIGPPNARRAGGPRGSLRAVAMRTVARICPNPRCRRANVTVARFCAQCGQRLEW